MSGDTYDWSAHNETAVMSATLVLIDLQNDCFPDGTIELVSAEAAVGRAAAPLQAFRRKSLPVERQ
jgi:nicotinamidase-related amidase